MKACQWCLHPVKRKEAKYCSQRCAWTGRSNVAIRQVLARWYTLSERDKGWLAGIVDGEGTILWRKRQQPSGAIRQPMIDIPNTDLRILSRLQQVLPFNNKLYTRPTPPGHKQLWYWRINGAKAVALIWLLRPYLATSKAD